MAPARVEERTDRRRRAAAILVIGAGYLLSAPPARSQTSDAVFGSWRFAQADLGSRPAGMGGAFVAVADETKASVANPAGLMLIPVTELNLSSGEAWAAAAGGHKWLRLAAYTTRLATRRSEGDGGQGFLELSGWETGVALALSPLSRFRVGATLAWSRLELEGESSPGSTGGGLRFGGEDTQARVTAGALIDLLGGDPGSLASLRLGFTYQSGADWSLLRTAPGAEASQAEPFELRRPTILSAGLAGRSSDRWGFSLQADLVRYREVLESLRRNRGQAASEFEMPDEIEPRFGVEYVMPLGCGCGLVRGRAGLHYRASGALRYEGSDPELAAAFRGGERRTAYSLGASFQTEHFGRALRLDVDARDVSEERVLSFGIVWRF
jgi:hypothetical protein